jgi:hypothetical protein
MGGGTEWHGLIAPIPGVAEGQEPLLPGTIGPVRIGDSIFGLMPGDGTKPYWAMRATGVIDLADWDSVRLEAARQLRLASSLMTVAYSPTRPLGWPRRNAESLPFDERPADEPSVWSGAVDIVREQGWWERVEADEVLRAAVLMHHEGVLLRRQHPSMAMLAFVSVVESIGAMYSEPKDRCPKCGNIAGSRQDFLGALRRLGWPDNWLRACRDVYDDYRSKTVHTSVLHGLEASYGVFAFHLGSSPYSDAGWTVELDFPGDQMGQVRWIEEASRAVLRARILEP